MYSKLLPLMILAALAFSVSCREVKRTAKPSFPPFPEHIEARGGSERIDIYWSEPTDWHNQTNWSFELQAQGADTAFFMTAHAGYLSTPAFSDFRRDPGEQTSYRVRTVILDSSQQVTQASAWSDVATAAPHELKVESLLDEVQEASFRYFWNYAHPVSGLPREGAGGWEPNMCSIAASGMMFFNIAVGIENGWITYDEGLAHADKALRFLAEKADRFHGVFPHWVNGETGKTIPFSDRDDGADLVESAFLISGALFFRDYVKDDASPVAKSIRETADALYRDVEWTWFLKERPDGRLPLLWHWSPNHGFAIDLEIVGFTECHMTYLLALASPTHPIPPESYFTGWIGPGYGHKRLHYDIELELGREPYGPPAFFTHYSYLGVHPKVFEYEGQDYFQHFQDFCRVQVLWAREHRGELAGTGIWGMTASLNPDGYGAQHPGNDNGTITPTAYLASFPYAPEAALRSLQSMYTEYGRQFWGPFGFYDAMNIERDWFADKYIAIDVGPVAPMIENHKTGLCWDIFTDSPEMKKARAMIDAGVSAN